MLKKTEYMRQVKIPSSADDGCQPRQQCCGYMFQLETDYEKRKDSYRIVSISENGEKYQYNLLKSDLHALIGSQINHLN